ncbi:hypothetical protein [Selenomonas dianae]|jgi:hypothetical protein|uniref:Histidine kinase n=1 Tax=Selenomonas dianae TaxID=135079 RepID=A0ABP3CTS8_9FIRM|nr:hypothetical protein [Selenomonas dianae]WLD81453.1 hypothetical protein QU667_06275 [Selenomonas dianae]
MKDDRIEYDDVLSVLRKLFGIVVISFSLAASIQQLFLPGGITEITIIMILSFCIVGLLYYMLCLLKKINQFADRYASLKDECVKISEKHKALSEQFKEKTRTIDLISHDFSLVAPIIDMMAIQQEKSEHTKVLNHVKEVILKWSNPISRS